MSENPNPAAPEPEPAPEPAPAAAEAANLGDAGQKALNEERKARRDAEKQNKELASKLAALEDRDKTEAQRLADRAAQAEAALAQAQSEAMRNRVALAKGVPPELVDRLRGDTDEELAADADALLALLAPPEPPEPAPLDLGQGNRGSAALPLNGDPLLKAVRKTLGI